MNLRSPVKQKKEVMLLREDYRFMTLEVERETDYVAYCKKKEGIAYRIFKLGPGWTEKIVRFLTVEGIPIVHYVKASKEKAEATLEEYLKIIWTDTAYNNLPRALKEKLQEGGVGVTVEIQPLIPNLEMQKALDSLKAEGMLYDADIDNLSEFGLAKGVKKWTDKMIDKLPWILAGIGLTYILQGIGLIKGL